jgi:hypothetical protein
VQCVISSVAIELKIRRAAGNGIVHFDAVEREGQGATKTPEPQGVLASQDGTIAALAKHAIAMHRECRLRACVNFARAVIRDSPKQI